MRTAERSALKRDSKYERALASRGSPGERIVSAIGMGKRAGSTSLPGCDENRVLRIVSVPAASVARRAASSACRSPVSDGKLKRVRPETGAARQRGQVPPQAHACSDGNAWLSRAVVA